MSSISTRSTGHSWRDCVSESVLNPSDGVLKCRLNHTILHLPVKPDIRPKQAYCQLHYWCKSKRKYFIGSVVLPLSIYQLLTNGLV